MKYGYIRVSSNTQDETRQIEAIKKRNVLEENLFIEKSSGKNFIDRTEWQKLLSVLVIGDIVVIKELDRLGRNNKEIKENFDLLKKKGVFLEFIDDSILNTYGKSEIEIELIHPIILHLLGYQAEKERDKILKRQKESYQSLPIDEKGRKISRKKQKPVGRPNKIEEILKTKKGIIELWIQKKMKRKEVLEILNISERTLYRIKKEMKEGEMRK